MRRSDVPRPVCSLQSCSSESAQALSMLSLLSCGHGKCTYQIALIPPTPTISNNVHAAKDSSILAQTQCIAPLDAIGTFDSPSDSIGASEMLYSSSNGASESPFLSLKSTTRESLTAKTESSSRYLLFRSKICVVTGLYPSRTTCQVLVTTCPIQELRLTIRWICAGRYGCRSSSCRSFPAGPS